MWENKSRKRVECSQQQQRFGSSLSLSSLPVCFSLASVPLINSWLSSVTNVSLPSSSPGEEGGVFNVQFVLWIDVCWHRLSPSPAPCVIHYCTFSERFLRAFPVPFSHTNYLHCQSDTRRSTYVALMDGNGR